MYLHQSGSGLEARMGQKKCSLHTTVVPHLKIIAHLEDLCVDGKILKLILK